jgi:hypothetical protein
MTKADFIQSIQAAAAAGTLVTSKHGPVSGSTLYPTYRSVLTAAASSRLDAAIASGNFTVSEYAHPSHAGHQFVVCMGSPSHGPVALGFPSGSATASRVCDRYVFVSGSIQGWHVYGEEQSYIDNNVSKGNLALVRSF